MNSAAITSQPTEQATQPATTTQQPTVPNQPWRRLSTVERDLPAWVKATMQGKSSNGTFNGRGAK